MNKLLFYLLTVAVPLSAQQNSMTRQYVPIIISKSQNTPLQNLEIDNWTAYRYDAASAEWSPVPLQFDDKDDKDRYNKNDQDRRIDDNDELVVMPEDLGDKAGRAAWLSGVADQDRIELAFSDPLNAADSGWIYLFPGSVENPTSYFSYAPAPPETPAADTVKTAAYHVGHNGQGWLDFISLANDFNTNLIDRLKIRLGGENTTLGVSPYVLHENYIQSGEPPVEFIPGRVRAFQKVKSEIDLSVFNFPIIGNVSSPYYFQYFPYSFATSAETELEPGMLALFGLNLIRQSLDLSPAAWGMTFYSAANSEGLRIDGSPDQVDASLPEAQTYNWIMSSGPQGTIIVMFDLPEISLADTELYYQDDKTAVMAKDSTQDTGDGEAWGDMGIWVRATGDAIKLNANLNISFIGYLIPETDQNSGFAEQIVEWQTHPVTLTARRQTFSTSRVAERSNKPDQHRVISMVPNPYTTGKSGRIVLDLPDREDITVSIMNILGQHVKSWEIQNSAAQTQLIWNGLDERRQPVVPGVYIVHVTTETGRFTQKFAVVR
ncbi:MAG: T9SS type A sorting domain-containing protein [candidate division KSB1 bacterium]|nr:T9SS type A sorting domain-containing protein [candidate division KSB1 bacterium]